MLSQLDLIKLLDLREILCRFRRKPRFENDRVDLPNIVNQRGQVIPRDHIVKMSRINFNHVRLPINVPVFDFTNSDPISPYPATMHVETYSTEDLLKTVCFLQEMLDQTEDAIDYAKFPRI